MSINVTISNDQFITLYANSQFCRSFTAYGINTVLDHIQVQQEETDTEGEVIDWTAVFMSCSEYTDSDLIREFIDLVSEDTRNNAEDIQECVDEIVDRIDKLCLVTDCDSYIVFY